MQNLFVLFFLFLSFQIVDAQDWIYYVDDANSTNASISWIGEDGSSFHNILRGKKEGNSYAHDDQVLINLSPDGKLKKVFTAQNCKNWGAFFPFEEDKYYSLGQSCNEDFDTNRKIKVYDGNGKFLKTAVGYDGQHFMWYKGEDGFVLYADPFPRRDQDILSVTTMDWDLNIEHQQVDLSALVRPDHRFIHHVQEPLYMGSEGSVCKVKYLNGTSVKDEIIYFFKDNEFQWSYDMSPEAQNYVQGFWQYEDRIILIASEYRKPMIIQLDMKGNELSRAPLPRQGTFAKYKLIGDEIIAVGGRGSLSVKRYTLGGLLVGEEPIAVDGSYAVVGILPHPDGGFLLHGEEMFGDRAFVCKFGSSIEVQANSDEVTKEPEEVQVDEEVENDQLTISLPSIEHKEPISVVVYPNPASIDISFHIENPKQSNSGEYQLSIFTLQGKPVHQRKFTGEKTTIDVSSYIPGQYVYRIFSSEDHQMISGQFIKVE